MLAGARVDREHEHEPSWATRPFGRGGKCDCELHADSDGWIYACSLISASVGGRSIPLDVIAQSAVADCSRLHQIRVDRLREIDRVVRSPSLTDCCEYHMVINENRRSNERTANIRNQAIYTTPDRRRRIAAPGCLRRHQSKQRNSQHEAERASHLELDHVGQHGLDLKNETNHAQFTPGRGRCRGTYDGLDERIARRTARYGNDSKHV